MMRKVPSLLCSCHHHHLLPSKRSLRTGAAHSGALTLPFTSAAPTSHHGRQRSFANRRVPRHPPHPPFRSTSAPQHTLSAPPHLSTITTLACRRVSSDVIRGKPPAFTLYPPSPDTLSSPPPPQTAPPLPPPIVTPHIMFFTHPTRRRTRLDAIPPPPPRLPGVPTSTPSTHPLLSQARLSPSLVSSRRHRYYRRSPSPFCPRRPAPPIDAVPPPSSPVHPRFRPLSVRPILGRFSFNAPTPHQTASPMPSPSPAVIDITAAASPIDLSRRVVLHLSPPSPLHSHYSPTSTSTHQPRATPPSALVNTTKFTSIVRENRA
ncbi:hypothetical protein R3P38DRAFT_3592762 [Favolaschia claudopus]|uniref:Uncharacterized protein n=1 Tax=Favolaschia claudopus TaxID=2862362 RepID=A0AAW0AFI7_9AGAR